MSARRLRQMRAVLELAEREERDAGVRFAEQRRQTEHEREQLEQLEDYRRQYLADYPRYSGVDPASLQSYSEFLQRLGQAVDGQRHQLARVREQLEQARQHWQSRHHRRQTLEEMVERLRREREQALEHERQRELDDLAGQRLTRRGRRRTP